MAADRHRKLYCFVHIGRFLQPKYDSPKNITLVFFSLFFTRSDFNLISEVWGELNLTKDKKVVHYVSGKNKNQK